jgi:hypothetical protein
MQVKIVEVETDTTDGVEQVTITAESRFDTIALGKLADMLSEEQSYEQLISFLLGGREKALELHKHCDEEMRGPEEEE